MNKKLDKLKQHIKYDKKIFLFLIVLSVIGIIIGTLYTLILNENDKSLIIEYIQSFVENISKSKIIFSDYFINTLTTNSIYLLIITIIGLSIIGIPLIIIINFYKSFVIGFSISSFIITYGLKGCLLSFIYIFPHIIINLFIVILMSMYGIKLSLKLIETIIKKKTINFKLVIKKYIKVLFLLLIITLSTSIYESFVLPHLFKLIASFIF